MDNLKADIDLVRQKSAYLVLTGNIVGKTHDAIFMETNSTGRSIDKDELQLFRQAYGKFDDRSKQGRLLPDSNLKVWLGHFLHNERLEERWRKALAEQFDIKWDERGTECPKRVRPDDPPGIPVYFYEPTHERPLVIGMTQIMRLPSKRNVAEVVASTQSQLDQRDWTDAILGYVDKDGKGALRGRIDFAFAKGPKPSETKLWPNGDKCLRLTMMAPRVGHFATYLRRSGDTEKPSEWEPATYDEPSSKAAGRKIYPVWTTSPPQGAAKPFIVNVNEANEQSTYSFLQLLPWRSVFTAAIDVKNLLPAELGALLWVLSLGEEEAFAALDPTIGEPGNYFPNLSRYAHVAGRGRAFSFGHLIPGGIDLTEVKLSTGGGEIVDRYAAIHAFAQAVHGYEGAAENALDFLNEQVLRLRRLRNLSDRTRDPDKLGTKWPVPVLPDRQEKRDHDRMMFRDYSILRKAMSGAEQRDDVNANLNAKPKSKPEERNLAGNILDWGSDPD